MKRKRMAASLILICAVFGAIVVYLIVGTSAAPPANRNGKKPAPLVQVEPAQVTTIEQTLALTGEVVATNRVVVSAMKEGPIEFCPWREGDMVKTGETLVRIERKSLLSAARTARAALAKERAKLDDLQAGARPEEIRRAEANLKRAEAALAEARRNHERQSELFRTETVSQETLDKAQERLEIAEAELAAASETLSMLKAGPTDTEIAVQKAAVDEAAARLALAEDYLAECIVKAPFDGIVAKVYVRRGDVVSTHDPLVEMYDPASLVIRFAVPEEYARAVRKGMGLNAVLDAAPERTVRGEIVRVYPELDPVMRTRTVEAALVDSVEVTPNMFVRVRLVLARNEKALVIPNDAILLSPEGKRFVFVVDEGKAVRRVVQTGIENDALTQILSGVLQGERIAVAGNARLKPGIAVRVARGRGKGENHEQTAEEGSRMDQGRVPTSTNKEAPGE